MFLIKVFLIKVAIINCQHFNHNALFYTTEYTLIYVQAEGDFILKVSYLYDRVLVAHLYQNLYYYDLGQYYKSHDTSSVVLVKCLFYNFSLVVVMFCEKNILTWLWEGHQMVLVLVMIIVIVHY